MFKFKYLRFFYLSTMMVCFSMVGADASKFLKIPLHTSAIWLDPTQVQDFSSLWVSRQINCQLFRNRSGNLVLEVAKQIRYVNPTIIDIKLNKSFTFSNGNVVTADDVIASIMFLKQKRAVLRNALDWITFIKKINNEEIQIILNKPHTEFIRIFSAPHYSIFPASFIANAQNNPRLWQSPVSCGAYYSVKSDSKSFTILPRSNGWPVKFYYVPNGDVSAKQSQDFDLILLNVESSINQNRNFASVRVFDPFQFFYIPNTRKSPWNSRQARCALLARLDAGEPMQEYGSLVQPAKDLIPPGTLGYLDSQGYVQNISHLGKPFKLPSLSYFSFSFFQSSIESNVRPKFDMMFGKLFAKVRHNVINNDTSLAQEFAKTNADGMVLTLKSSDLDAYEYLLLFAESASNVSGYFSQNLVADIENSQKISSSQAKVQKYRQIINYLQDNCLIYPLFTMPYEKIYVKRNLDAQGIGLVPLNEYLLNNVRPNKFSKNTNYD